MDVRKYDKGTRSLKRLGLGRFSLIVFSFVLFGCTSEGFKSAPTADGGSTLSSEETGGGDESVDLRAVLTSDVSTLYTNSQTISFNFNTSKGEEAGFECQIDGANYAPCQSPLTLDNLAEGSHSFGVRAFDSEGKRGNPLAQNWVVDMTPPTIQVNSQPAAVTTESTATIAFQVTDSGGGAVNFNCALDGTLLNSCAPPLSLTNLGMGSHTLKIQATDAANNNAEQDIQWSVVQPQAPVTTITKAPNSPHKANQLSFEFSANDPQATFTCRLDGGGFSACSSPMSYQNVADGNHKFDVRATSAPNLTGNVATSNVLVDVNPAVLTLNTPVINMGDASFSFSANDGAGSGSRAL